MKKRILLSLSAALLLASCSKEQPVVIAGQTEVKFTGNLTEIVTRVGGETGADWHADDPVGIYMFKADPGTLSDGNIVAANKHHKATAGPSASFAPGDGTHLIYPTDGSGVKFVAYYPHSTSVSADYKVSFSVATQTNLSAIDVLHAPVTAAFNKSSTTAVPLQFAHKLTKLIFNVTNGTGVTEPVENGISVEISGQQTAGTLDLATGGVASTGEEGVLTVNGAAKIEAIVLPKDPLSEVTATFTNDAGQSFTVEIPTAKWEGGKQYTYTVTLKAADKRSEISGEIDPWGDGGTTAITGNEELETGAEGEKHSISFEAEGAWTATVEESGGGTRAGGSEVEWLRLTQDGEETYGGEAGTVTLNVEIDPNFSGEERRAQITIDDGTTRSTIRVTQSATGKDGEVPTPGGEMTLYMYGTGSVTINWGDDRTTSHNLRGNANIQIKHLYAKGGEYIATIKGNVTTMFAIDPSFSTSFNDYDIQPALIYLKSTGGLLTTNDPNRDEALVEALYDRNMAEVLDLSGNTTITGIDFGNYKPVKSLNMNGCTALKTITSQGSGMSAIDLGGCTALEYLNLYVNPITSIDLGDCTALTDLVLAHYSRNDPPLNGIDLANNTALKMLILENTGLTTLDLSHNRELENLYCPRNRLTELNLSNNPKIYWLVCESNQLNSLNVRNLPDLEMLAFAFNSIASIDVSQNPLLESLSCNRNGISDLDLSGNPKLNALECPENQLSSLDLSGNPLLSTLYCKMNGLTHLDLRANARLQTLDCSGNYLYGMDIDNMPTLWDFNCSDNNMDSDVLRGLIVSLHRNGWHEEYEPGGPGGGLGDYFCEDPFADPEEDPVIIVHDNNKTINVSGNPGAWGINISALEEETGWAIVN